MEPMKRRCLLFEDGFAPEGVEFGDDGAAAAAPPKKRGKGRRRSKSSMTVLKRAIAKSNTPEKAMPIKDSETGSTTGGKKPMFELFLESIESSEGTISDRLNKKHRHFDAALAEAWVSSLSKKQRRTLAEADRRRIAEATHATRTLQHNFDANPDDHCETSVEAYADIAPLLKKYAARIGKSPSQLRIYDPYFCAGSVKKNLAALGFPNVYNENEDFYAQIANGTLPKFDVLVTNPPYSKDHVLKLLDFAASQPQPHFLCMPSYVLVQPEYQCGHPEKRGGQKYLAVVPQRRYMYWTPKGMRSKDKTQNHASSRGYRTSPFLSFWYVGLKSPVGTSGNAFTEEFVRSCYANSQEVQVCTRDTLPESYSKS